MSSREKKAKVLHIRKAMTRIWNLNKGHIGHPHIEKYLKRLQIEIRHINKEI